MSDAEQGGWSSAVEPPPTKPFFKRGWVIALLVSFGLLCLLSGACLFSCGVLFNKSKTMGAKQLTEVVKQAAASHPNFAAYQKDLEELDRLVQANELNLVALGQLSNQVQVAQQDRKIDHAEVESIMATVATINQNHGKLQLRRPPKNSAP